MGLRDENPFIDSDLQVIIAAYEGGVNSQETETSLYPMFGRLLVKVKTSAKNGQRNAQDYLGKQAPVANATDTINPGDVVNSISTERPSDTLEDIKKHISECIPCKLRPNTNSEFPEWSELGDLFEQDFDRLLSMLDDIEDAMSSPVVFDELCELLNALKQNCIPDLVRVLGLLRILLSKMSVSMNTELNGIFAFASIFLGALLQSVSSMLDRFNIGVTLPIECILNALEAQYAELNRQIRGLQTKPAIVSDVQEALSVRNRDHEIVFGRGENREESPHQRLARRRAARAQENGLPRQPIQIPAPPLQSVGSALRTLDQATQRGGGLLVLKEQIRRGSNLLQQTFDYYREQLESMMGLENSQDNKFLEFLKAKQELIRSIALVKALVEGAANGISCGNGKPLTLPELELLGTTIANPRERQVTVDPSGDISITLNPRADSGPAVVIKSKSCLKSVSSVDLARLSAWSDRLDEAIPDL